MRLWTFDVIALVVVPHVWFVLPRNGMFDAVAVAAITVLLLGMAGLILTTPPNAIRLPPWRSVYILTGLTAVLVLHAWGRFDRTAAGGLGGLLIVAAAAVVCVVAVRRRVTPWWAAVLFWSPPMVGPVAWPLPVAGGMAVGIAAAFVAVVCIRKLRID